MKPSNIWRLALAAAFVVALTLIGQRPAHSEAYAFKYSIDYLELWAEVVEGNRIISLPQTLNFTFKHKAQITPWTSGGGTSMSGYFSNVIGLTPGDFEEYQFWTTDWNPASFSRQYVHSAFISQTTWAGAHTENYDDNFSCEEWVSVTFP